MSTVRPIDHAAGGFIEPGPVIGILRGTITRKGGKVVTIPLAPRTARAIDLALGERTGGPVFLAYGGAHGAHLDLGGARGEEVADAVRVVRESGLPNRTDAMFTTIEGDWD
jgi:Thiamine-binding protein